MRISLALLVLAVSAPMTPEARPPVPPAEPITARYLVDGDGRSRSTFALPPGPREIRELSWVPSPRSPADWKTARLRLVLDAEDPADAEVDLPLGSIADPGDDWPIGGEVPLSYRRNGRLVLDAEGPIRGTIRLEASPVGAGP